MNLPDRDPPVTIDIIHKVKPGSEDAFELILTDIINAAESYEGHLGSNVFRTLDRNSSEYRIVYKFDHLSNLRQWENSDVRKVLVEKAKRFTIGEGKLQVISGLETWFTLSSQGAIIPPPRYKMVIISSLAIYVLINLIPNLVVMLVGEFVPKFLATLLVTLIMSSLMTYIIMPRLTKLFAWWLYPKTSNY